MPQITVLASTAGDTGTWNQPATGPVWTAGNITNNTDKGTSAVNVGGFMFRLPTLPAGALIDRVRVALACTAATPVAEVLLWLTRETGIAQASLTSQAPLARTDLQHSGRTPTGYAHTTNVRQTIRDTQTDSDGWMLKAALQRTVQDAGWATNPNFAFYLVSLAGADFSFLGSGGSSAQQPQLIVDYTVSGVGVGVSTSGASAGRTAVNAATQASNGNHVKIQREVTTDALETIFDNVQVSLPSSLNSETADPGWLPNGVSAFCDTRLKTSLTTLSAHSAVAHTLGGVEVTVGTSTLADPDPANAAHWTDQFALAGNVLFPGQATRSYNIPLNVGRLPVADDVRFYRIMVRLYDPDALPSGADSTYVAVRFAKSALTLTNNRDLATVDPTRTGVSDTVLVHSGVVQYTHGAKPADWGADGTLTFLLRDEDAATIQSATPTPNPSTGAWSRASTLPNAATHGLWDGRATFARSGTSIVITTSSTTAVRLVAQAVTVLGFDGDDNTRSTVDDSANGNRFDRGAPIRVDVAWFNDGKNRATTAATIVFGNTGTLALSADAAQGANTGNAQSLNQTFTAGSKAGTIGGTGQNGVPAVGGVLGFTVPSITGFVNRVFGFHMQPNDNVLGPAKDVASLLSSDLAFMSVKVMNNRLEAVVGAILDFQVQDAGNLIPAVNLGTAVSTTTVNGNRGYVPLSSNWDKSKPGGGWLFQARLTAAGANRANGPTVYTTDGTFDDTVTLLAPDPALRVIVGGGAYGEAADKDHWHAGEPLLVGLALIDFVTGKLVLPDSGSAKIMVGRFRQSLGRAEYLDSDLTWKQITTTTAAYNWPLAPSAGDPNVFVFVFADTSGFSSEELHLVGKCTVNSTPYSGPAHTAVLDVANRHDRYALDPVAFALHGIISYR